MENQMPSPSFTSPSTTASTHSSVAQMNANRVMRKRNRVPLSCKLCRDRKLKCDRGQPCDNCSKRGIPPNECQYATAPVRKRTSVASAGNIGGDDMQNRIDRLENLVLSLVTNGPSPSPAAASAAINQVYKADAGASVDLSLSRTSTAGDVDSNAMDEDGDDDEVQDVSQSIGLMRVQNGKSYYVSNTHWYTMLLNDFKEMKALLSNTKQWEDQHQRVADSCRDDLPGAAYLFRAPRLNDISELRAELPNRALMDRLIERYFASYDPGMNIIHGQTFQKKYQAYWANPKESTPVFLSTVFALMTIALQSYQRVPGEASELQGNPVELANKYRRLTAQGIVLADPRDSHIGLIELLLLHLQAELSRSRDTENGIQILGSIISRHAMKMGYHRDPSNYPNMSVFDGEMRRRVWAAVRVIDYIYSFQCGLTAVIRTECANTRDPANLYEDELSEDMISLPPPRDPREATPMSYMLAKMRLGYLFGKIHDRVTNLGKPPSYEDVMDLDAELRGARRALPPHLQWKAIHESMQDSPAMVKQRLGLEMLYLKSLCILHRRFIMKNRSVSRYLPSRRSCLDAALDTLAHHSTLHRETRPGGLLHLVKWELLPVSSNDITMAAMVICMDLYYSFEEERQGHKTATAVSTAESWTQHQRQQMIQALHDTLPIFYSRCDASMEAFKGYKIVGTMIDKLKASQAMLGTDLGNAQASHMDMTTSNGGTGPVPNGSGGQAFYNNGNAAIMTHPNGSVAPEHSAAMTLGLLSAGGVSPGAAVAQTGLPQAPQGMTGADASIGMQGMGMGINNDDLTGSFARYLDDISTQMPDNIPWENMDSYIQAPALDAMSMWPQADQFDMSILDPSLTQR